MQNLSALANAITSQKPELELTQVWGNIMRANNVPLNEEESNKVQTLVVDAYQGIKQKLGRTAITPELVSGAVDEVSEMIGEIATSVLGSESKGFADGLSDLMNQAMQNGGMLDLGELKIKVGSSDELKEMMQGALNPNNDPQGGKMVELPKTRQARKKAVEEPETV